MFGVHLFSLLAACSTCSVAGDHPVRRVDRSQSTLQSRTQPFHPAAHRADAATLRGGGDGERGTRPARLVRQVLVIDDDEGIGGAVAMEAG
jgi:hypothetical protein